MSNQRTNQRQQRSSTSRRGSKVSPSTTLRPYFVSLARQVQRWIGNQPRPVSIGVTSLANRVGRSTVSFNLAAALTSVIRSEVLLTESDFGRHYVTRRLGHARSPGLSELILGVSEPDDVIHETPSDDLFVVGCGRKSGQEALELPFDLLGNVVREQFGRFGCVVFDLPVASHLTACYSLATQLDGVILVVEANQIDQRQIGRFRKQMKGMGVDIVGVVMNKS